MYKELFRIVVNGNKEISTSTSYKRSLNKCLRLSADKLTYVELWCIGIDGSQTLIGYWNKFVRA